MEIKILNNTYLRQAAIICCIHNRIGDCTERYTLDFIFLKQTTNHLILARDPSTSHSQINIFTYKKKQAVISL